MRRLPHAAVPDLQRQQEVAQPQHVHRDLRGPEVQPVRRLCTHQVRPMLPHPSQQQRVKDVMMIMRSDIDYQVQYWNVLT